MPLTDPIKDFLNNKYETIEERDNLLDSVINECEDYITYLIDYNDKKDVRQALHEKIESSDKRDNRMKLIVKQYKLSSESELKSEKLKKHQFTKFKIGLLQKKYLMDTIVKDINSFKKKKAILVLKSSSLGYYINIIQISIIIISSLITFFESIKNIISFTALTLTIIPVLASTYIAFILAVSRFFKLDIKKENVAKVIEKYSFIISRLKHKLRRVVNFDFKSRKITDWNQLIENFSKDGIEDIITKTTEESDTLITLKENVYYQNIFFKLKLKKTLQHYNQDKLPCREKNYYYGNLGNLNKYKKRKCRCPCSNLFNCCYTTNLDYEKIYELIDINDLNDNNKKNGFISKKRRLCNEINSLSNNKRNNRKFDKNFLTTFALMNNDNIDLTYEDFIINNEKKNENINDSDYVNNIDTNDEITKNISLKTKDKNIDNTDVIVPIIDNLIDNNSNKSSNDE